MAMDLFSKMEKCRMVSQESRKEYENMITEVRNQASFSRTEMLSTEISGGISLEKYGNGDSGIEGNTIRIVKEYIKEHYAEDFHLGELAGSVYLNCSVFQLFFLFGDRTKISRIIWQKSG